MQALRRLASQAGLLPAGVRGLAGRTKLVDGKAPENTVDKIGLAVTTAGCFAFIGYDVMYPEEEFEGVIPEYPYLRMRTRDTFPWGTDMGPFELHRIVGGSGHHHEH